MYQNRKQQQQQQRENLLGLGQNLTKNRGD